MTDAIDELFAGSIDDFVKRRDELVRQLKNDGDKETAAAVKALRKPSAAAWAVNQVARREPEAIDELIAAARDVHAAQARAVQGKDGSGLRSATEDWRFRIRALAEEVAKDAGAQHRDDAAATFEAGSTNEEWSAVLKAGRLTAVLSPSGFGLQDMPEPILTPRPQARAEPEPVEVTRDEEAIAHARAQLEKVTLRLRRAEQRLEQAREAVDDATKARDAAAEALRDLEG